MLYFTVIIVVQVVILLIVMYFMHRWFIPYFKKTNLDIRDSVKDGIKDAIKELEYEKEIKEEKIKKLLVEDNSSPGVYSSTNQEEEPINSGGDLIQFNMTDKEKEILRMFYSQ